MKNTCIALSVITALAGMLVSCSESASGVSRLPVSAKISSDPSLSGKLFDEVNSYRASKGKAALQRHSGLDRLAQKHCDYLVRTAGSYSLHGPNISHIGFDGRAVEARHHHHINSLGENIATSTNHSPKHLLALWAGSSSHEKNMRGDWYCSGIATAVTADGMVITTQLFGTPPSSTPFDMGKRYSR